MTAASAAFAEPSDRVDARDLRLSACAARDAG